MVKNEAGEFYDLSFTTCFLTSEKHSFGVHTDKSPKICTHVEQIFLYKAGLLLNIDIAVPFYPSALRAGGVLSSRSGRAAGRAAAKLAEPISL